MIGVPTSLLLIMTTLVMLTVSALKVAQIGAVVPRRGAAGIAGCLDAGGIVSAGVTGITARLTGVQESCSGRMGAVRARSWFVGQSGESWGRPETRADGPSAEYESTHPPTLGEKAGALAPLSESTFCRPRSLRSWSWHRSWSPDKARFTLHDDAIGNSGERQARGRRTS